MTEEESKKFALVRHLQATANASKNFTLAQFAKVSAGGASYSDFKGATSTTSGKSGLVPAPVAGDEEKFLRADGVWIVPTYADATTVDSGLMSASDKAKLDGIDTDAEENAIEEIFVDDVKQSVTNKKASLDLSDYAKKSSVASVWKRKGSVNSFSNLPADAEEGDVYNIKTAGGTDDFGVSVRAGDNVARTFDGKWDVLAGTVDLSGYVEKVTGKQLSTNDFTDAQKTKLNNLASITSAGTNITISGGKISAADTTYSNATTSKSGLMSSSDKSKLNGIAANANNYTLPTATASALGGVKVGSGISVSNGTISVPTVTSSANGLMTSTDKKKLDSLASITTAGANITISGGTISAGGGGNYSLPTANSTQKGGVKIGNGLSMNGEVLSRSDAFSNAVTLSGGFNARSVASDLTYSKIYAEQSTVYAGQSTAYAEQSTLVADNSRIAANYSSIDVASSEIVAWHAYINACTSSIEAVASSIDANNASINAHVAFITGDPFFRDSPIFNGEVIFNKPLAIVNTSGGFDSTIKGALCFDMDSGKPRLKMRISGSGSSYTDYIFNCDTSITGGTG